MGAPFEHGEELSKTFIQNLKDVKQSVKSKLESYEVLPYMGKASYDDTCKAKDFLDCCEDILSRVILDLVDFVNKAHKDLVATRRHLKRFK